jgi:hypothetical protein
MTKIQDIKMKKAKTKQLLGAGLFLENKQPKLLILASF